MEKKEKTTFKIYIGGEPCTYGVQLISIYLNGKYEDKDFGELLSRYNYSKEITVNKKEYKIIIWNSHSSERFTNFEPNLCKGTKLVIILYSIAEERTFQFAKRSIESLKKKMNYCTGTIILLGVKYTKSMSNEKISQEAKNFSLENNIEFREITLDNTDEINKFFTDEVNNIINTNEEESKPKEETEAKKKCVIF